MRPALLVATAALAAASELGSSSWRSASSRSYDVVVLGTGLKESLLSGLLTMHGKRVLQLERGSEYGGSSASVGLQELADRIDGPGTALPEGKVGKAAEYSLEPTPKLFMAGGEQLRMLVNSGAWQHMNPPGFKRVQRSLLFRRRPDGQPDVHRVLANSEDIVKTRVLAPLEKARAVQFFLWVEKYDEEDPRTYRTSMLSKRTLDLHKMSAAKFLAYWELPSDLVTMVTRGMALLSVSPKRLKRMPAIELVRRLKRYKESYRTFPHMTSPYVYPVGGFGSALPSAMARVLEEGGGAVCLDRPIDEVVADDGEGRAAVVSEGVRVSADCVVAGPEYAPQSVGEKYKVVRLYAVLAHPPNMCKDAKSCQLIVPSSACGRAHDVYFVSAGSVHGVAPRGKWAVVASARVEGPTDGLTALEVARRELACVLPLLKPV